MQRLNRQDRKQPRVTYTLNPGASSQPGCPTRVIKLKDRACWEGPQSLERGECHLGHDAWHVGGGIGRCLGTTGFQGSRHCLLSCPGHHTKRAFLHPTTSASNPSMVCQPSPFLEIPCDCHHALRGVRKILSNCAKAAVQQGKTMFRQSCTAMLLNPVLKLPAHYPRATSLLFSLPRSSRHSGHRAESTLNARGPAEPKQNDTKCRRRVGNRQEHSN